LDIGKAEDDVKRANEELKQANQNKVLAQEKYQIAVRGSQLHSLASILFRKDPTLVEDAEVSYLLQFFVYIPALLVAFSSTLVAITAVHSVRPKKESRIIYPEGSEQFLLGPFTKTIIEKIKGDLNKTHAEADAEIANAIKKQKSSSKPDNKSNKSAEKSSDSNLNKSPTDAG
jgi:hypothetical protein